MRRASRCMRWSGATSWQCFARLAATGRKQRAGWAYRARPSTGNVCLGMSETRGRLNGWSVRYRLLAIALLPMLVVLPLLLAGTIARWNAKFNALLISKVNGDLTIAHEYLAQILDNTRDQIRGLARSAALRDVVRGETAMPLAAYLDESRQELKLDFLFIVDPAGGIAASAPPEVASSAKVDWPIIQKAEAGISSSGIDIFQTAQ